jgi:hypothetical protein
MSDVPSGTEALQQTVERRSRRRESKSARVTSSMQTAASAAVGSAVMPKSK